MLLNLLLPDSVIPIHRHNESSETVIICRGKVREEFYDDNGQKIAEYRLNLITCFRGEDIVIE